MHIDEAEFGWVSDSCEAVVLIVLDDALADTLFEKSRIGENEFAALDLGWVRRQQVVDEPGKLLSLNGVLVVIDPGFDWVHQLLHFVDGVVLELELAGCAVGPAKEPSFCPVNLMQLVAIYIVRRICGRGSHYLVDCTSDSQGTVLVDASQRKTCHFFAVLARR